MGNKENIIICANCAQGIYWGRETDVIVCCPRCGAVLTKSGNGG